MEKYKIFVYDNLCLGFPDSITYLKDQTYHSQARLGLGYALYYSGNLYLVRAQGMKGCRGEIFEVSEKVLIELNKKYGARKYSREEVIVTDELGAEHKVWTYLFDINELKKKNFRTVLIDSYRDMSPALKDRQHPPKVCC